VIGHLRDWLRYFLVLLVLALLVLLALLLLCHQG
jgi:hypothetical protein